MLDNKLNVENIKYEITFNYEFLDDLYSVLNWAEKGSSDSGSSTGELKLLISTKILKIGTPKIFTIIFLKL